MRDLADHRSEPPAEVDSILSVGFVGSIGRSCFSDLLLRAAPTLETAYRSASRKALLAALAAGRLDVAVYPGAPAITLDTALLCEDRLLAVLRPSHYLARSAAVGMRALARRTVLLPSDGEEGDLRRLAQALLPGLERVVEQPMTVLLTALRDTDAVALVPAGQADEFGTAVRLRPLAVAAAFPIQIAWSPAARAPLASLIEALPA